MDHSWLSGCFQNENPFGFFLFFQVVFHAKFHCLQIEIQGSLWFFFDSASVTFYDHSMLKTVIKIYNTQYDAQTNASVLIQRQSFRLQPSIDLPPAHQSFSSTFREGILTEFFLSTFTFFPIYHSTHT